MKICKGLPVIAALMSLAVSAGAADTVIPRGTVIPVTLDTTLSSATNKVGDTFVARHQGVNGAGFPENTKFTGKVESVTRASGKEAGQISVSFIGADLPDGSSIPINGRLASLDDKTIKSDPDSGRLVAASPSRKANTKFIAYGAGAGLVIGELTGGRGFLGAILGGAAGYFYGQKRGSAALGKNVRVPSGTRFGVMLDDDVALIPAPSTAVGGVTSVTPETSAGWKISFKSLKPSMSGSELMLPFRYVMDQIAMPFDYDASTKTIRVSQEGSLWVHTVGSTLVYVDGKATKFDAASRIMSGAIYVPAGYIELLTNRTAYWNPKAGMLRLE